MKNLFKALAAFFGFNNAREEEPGTKQKPKEVSNDTKVSVTKKTSNTAKASTAKKEEPKPTSSSAAKTSNKAKTSRTVKKAGTASVQDNKKRKTGAAKEILSVKKESLKTKNGKK